MAGDRGEDGGDTTSPGLPVGHSYRRFEVLGTGAMGTVYRAEDRQGNELAVKLLRAELTTDPVVLARFIQERALLIRLASPNIVRVVDLVVEGDTMAIVMEKVDGGSLKQYLNRLGDRLPPAEAVRLSMDILEALAVAHAQGVVHRDIKPDNVLIDDEAQLLRAKVTDFGISGLIDGSAHTRLTSLVGTPEYMAPELVESVQATGAVDIYSAGIVLYELIAGKTPFAGGGVLAILKRHAEQMPERPEGMGDELWSTILAMLAKDPADRPTAQQARHDLAAILEGNSQTLLRQPKFLEATLTADPAHLSDSNSEMIESVPNWPGTAAEAAGASVVDDAVMTSQPSFDSPDIEGSLIDGTPGSGNDEGLGDSVSLGDSANVMAPAPDIHDTDDDNSSEVDAATRQGIPRRPNAELESEVLGIVGSADPADPIADDPAEVDEATVKRVPSREPGPVVPAAVEASPSPSVAEDVDDEPWELGALGAAAATAAASAVVGHLEPDLLPTEASRNDPPASGGKITLGAEDLVDDTSETESSRPEPVVVDLSPSDISSEGDPALRDAAGEPPPDSADILPPLSDVLPPLSESDLRVTLSAVGADDSGSAFKKAGVEPARREDPSDDGDPLAPTPFAGVAEETLPAADLSFPPPPSTDQEAEGTTGDAQLDDSASPPLPPVADSDQFEPPESEEPEEEPIGAGLASHGESGRADGAASDSAASDSAASDSAASDSVGETALPDGSDSGNVPVIAVVSTDLPEEIDEATTMRPAAGPTWTEPPGHTPPSSGRKRRLLVVGGVSVVVVVAIVLAAILLTGSKGVAAAATVDGVAIPQTQFNSDLAAIKSSPTYQCYLNAQAYESTNGESILPSPSAPTFAAYLLQTEIGHQMVETLAAKRHVVVTPQQIAAARQELSSQITDVMSSSGANSAPKRDTCGSQVANPGAAILASLPSSFAQEQEQFVATDTDLRLVESGIGDKSTDLERYFTGHRSLFDQDCYTAVEYPTLAEAQAAYARIAAGASFSQVALNGESGSQTCATGSDIAASLPASVNFASLNLNQVSMPFLYNSKYDLLQINSQKANSFATAQTKVTSAVQSLGQQSTQSALAALERRAKVWVNPSYGSWQTQSSTVAPPKAGSATTSTGG